MRLQADQGTFLLYSGATYLNFPRRAGGGVARQFGKNTDGPIVTTGELRLDEVNASVLTPQQMGWLLAKEHERDHFENYFSSPVGVLIYRCYQTLISTGNWLFRSFFIPGELSGDVVQGIPLKDWIAREGLAWIRERIYDGRVPVPGDDLEKVSEDQAKAGIMWYLETEVLPELDLVSQFLDLILHRAPPGFTMGQFAALANQVFVILARRGDVPWTQQWTTEEPDDEMHPDWFGLLSTTELFELSALAREHNVLTQTGVDAEALRRWKEAYAASPYIEGLSLAEQTGIPFQMFTLLLRTALQSPCDIVFNEGGEMIVESLLPSWRFRNLLRCLIDGQEFPNPGDTREVRIQRWGEALAAGSDAEAVLCTMAPVPVPRWTDAYKTAAGRAIFGKGANILPTVSSELQLLDVRHGVNFVAETFEVCLAAAARLDWATIRRVPECIVYCEDEATFPGLKQVQQMSTVIGAHLGIVADFLQLSVMMTGLPLQVIPPFTTAITRRMSALAQTDDLKGLGEVLKATTIADQVFGKQFSKFLNL